MRPPYCCHHLESCLFLPLPLKGSDGQTHMLFIFLWKRPCPTRHPSVKSIFPHGIVPCGSKDKSASEDSNYVSW